MFLQSIPDVVCSPKEERKNFFSGISYESLHALCCSAEMYGYFLRQCSCTLTTSGLPDKYVVSETSRRATLLSASSFLPSLTWTYLVSPSILTAL